MKLKKLIVLIVFHLMLLTAYTRDISKSEVNTDSLKLELAKTELFAIGLDSIVVEQTAQLILKDTTISIYRKKLRVYIKDLKNEKKITNNQAKTILKLSNDLIKAEKGKFTFFLIGAGVGVFIETVGIVLGIVLIK